MGGFVQLCGGRPHNCITLSAQLYNAFHTTVRTASTQNACVVGLLCGLPCDKSYKLGLSMEKSGQGQLYGYFVVILHQYLQGK